VRDFLAGLALGTVAGFYVFLILRGKGGLLAWILATLALPRDLSVPIVIAWIWLGFWTSAKPPEQPPLPTPWSVGWTGQEEGHGVLMSELLKGDGPWVVADPKPRWLERFRNGWTFIGGTVLAVGLIFLIYATDPYLWVL
jgi:hypothetical protein